MATPTACPWVVPPPGPVVNPPPVGSLNVVTDFGASGNGIDNDTAHINAGIAAAVAADKSLYFPPGARI